MLLRFGLGFLRRGFLRFGAIENNGAVLCAAVVALAVQSRRVVSFPKSCQQPLVGNDCGIVFDLNDLGMPGVAGANILVGWVICRASRVAASDRLNAGEHLEDRFGAPEAAAAESGEFSFVGQAVNILRLSESCSDAADQRAEDQ